MKIRLDLPHPMETESVEADTDLRWLDVTPRNVRGQPALRVFYLSATGDGGASAKATVSFNTRTGKFSVFNQTDMPKKAYDFDLPVNEFSRRKEVSQQKGRARAATKPDPPQS